MKITYFNSILSFFATIIIGYWAFYIANSNNDQNDVIVGLGTAISVLLTLGTGLGFSLEDSRVNVNMKILCLVAFVLLMIVNFCYAYFGVSIPYYIIVVGLLLIVFIGIFKKISNIKDI